MIKAEVLEDFLDRENRGLLLKKGETIERPAARIKYLVGRGLVEADESIDKEQESIEDEESREEGQSTKEAELEEKSLESGESESTTENPIEDEESRGSEKKPTGEIDLSKRWNLVIADVRECEEVALLKEALVQEEADKNRSSIVDSIEARIEELSKK